MTNVQREIDEAFRLLSAIFVSGDGVELMAAAKKHLRRAFEFSKPVQEEDALDGR